MKLSLKAKAFLLIIIVGVLIALAAVIVYDRGISTLVTREYEDRSMEITEVMAQIIDSEKVRTLRDNILRIYEAQDKIVYSDDWGTPEFEEYLSKYSSIEGTEEFMSLREQLRNVQDVLDVECLYVVWLDLPNRRYVYLVDGAYEDACPPGCVDPLFVDFPDIDDNPDKVFAPNVTHTEMYGYLVTTGAPIFAKDGEKVGFAAVDISMNYIVAKERDLLLMSVLVFGIVTVLACMIAMYLVDRAIVRPINKLSDAAKSYTVNSMTFSEVDIHTRDEVQTLSDSMKRMEQDIRDYYDNLMATRNDLETAKEHAEVYRREANIDPLTGLSNKRAYEITMTDIECEGGPFAIVMIDLNDLKVINDRYGHDKGDVTIKNLAGLIRKVFDGCPVFRFGGDEFVVLLTDGNLAAGDKLVKRFRDEVGKIAGNGDLQLWEKPSAACGYAVYDSKTDDGVTSVFKRADEDMYKHKIEMKKNR